MQVSHPMRAQLMVALLLAAGFTIMISILFYEPAVIYSDAGEYMKMGKLISYEYRPVPVEVAQERIVKGDAPLEREFLCERGSWKYPPGYPLLLSIPCYVWGPRGMFALGPALLFLTLMAFYHLCDRISGGWTAVLALPLAVLVPSVTMNFMWGTSHMLTSLLLLSGLILLCRWMKSDKRRDLVLCGLVIGSLPLVRNPEIIFTVAVGLTVLVLAVRRGRGWPGRLFSFCAGAGLPLLILAVYNNVSFGSPLRTGYFLSGEQSAFSASVLGRNVIPYIQLLVSECGAHILLLAVLGMILMWRASGNRAFALVISICVPSAFLLYMSYDWYADMRFLLPCLFLVVLATVFFLGKLRQLAGGMYSVPVIAVLLALSAVNAAPHFALTLPMWSTEAELVRGASDLVISRCPRGSVVVTDWRICQDLDVTGDFILIGLQELELHPEAGIREIARISEDGSTFYLLGYPDLLGQVELLLPERLRAVRLDTFPMDGPEEHSFGVLPDQISVRMVDSGMLLLQGYQKLLLVRIEPRVSLL